MFTFWVLLWSKIFVHFCVIFLITKWFFGEIFDQLCYPLNFVIHCLITKFFFLLSRNIFVIPWWITKFFLFRYPLNFVIPWWITKIFLGLLSTQLCYPLVDNKNIFFCYPMNCVIHCRITKLVISFPNQCEFCFPNG